MGLTLKISSAGAMGMASSRIFFDKKKLDDADFRLDELDYIAIKYQPSGFFAKIPHTYVICSTYTGKTLRIDYTPDKGIVSSYDYLEVLPAKLLKESKAIPSTTVKRALKVFEKHANKASYSLISHNCKTVSQDFYDEITGNDEVNLAYELAEIAWDNQRMYTSRPGKYRKLFFPELRAYFCKIIKIALKQGKTKEQIHEVFEKVKKSNSLDSFIDACKEIITGEEEYLESLRNTFLKQHMFNDFLYYDYRWKMKIINKHWMRNREAEAKMPF